MMIYDFLSNLISNSWYHFTYDIINFEIIVPIDYSAYEINDLRYLSTFDMIICV